MGQTDGLVCDSCGKVDLTTVDRENGNRECDPCWRSALAHGHIHGLHQDLDGEAEYVVGCPLCPVTR